MDKKYKIHIVPHTHWDREWYFTFEEFRYRLVKLMDILIDLMEKGEVEYFILDGQTIALKDYIEVRPENEERLKILIKDRRLFIGPWYTQPNIFMSGAEAQVRNLLKGKKDMEYWGGGMDDINYMPDQFGYTSQLPQIMAEFGMTHLVGARGLPKQCRTYFKWEGCDGSRVHVCALPHSYNNACGLSDRTEQKILSVFGEKIVLPSIQERVEWILTERERAVSPQILAMNGVDHMYPNTSMLSTIEKIRELYTDIEVEQSNFNRYIEEVENTLEREPEVYYGEQRDPRENFILPASQSTRMNIKKYNRKMEDIIERRVEPLLSVMSSIGEKNLPFTEYRIALDYLLQNQAHDSLCCANSEPSYREIYTRFEKADDICREICNELEQRFMRCINELYDEAVIICNPSPFEREEPVTAEIIVSNNRTFQEPHIYFEDDEIPAYIVGVRNDTLLRFVPSTGIVGQLQVTVFTITFNPGKIQPMGYKLFEIKGGKAHDRVISGLAKDVNSIENEYLKIIINSDASLTVTDKRTGQTYKNINRFMESGETGCGFIHTPPYNDITSVSCGKNIETDIIENTPEKSVIKVTQSMAVPKGLSEDKLGRSQQKTDMNISSKIILRAGCPYVEFETEIENTALDHRIRVAFPSDVDYDTGYAGQPFDVITRPVQPENVNHLGEGEYEPYVGYHPMNDFCGISDGIRGMAAAGDGIMEYEILPERNTVVLTLIRGTDRLHMGVLASGSKFKIPEAQLLGKHKFRYAFIPHTGGFEKVLSAVEQFRHPIYAVQKDFLEMESMPNYELPAAVLGKESGFIKVDGEVVTTAVKPAENGDGIILRMYNPFFNEREIKVKIDNEYLLEKAYISNLEETKNNPVLFKDNIISIKAGAKKIITLRLNICKEERKKNREAFSNK